MKNGQLSRIACATAMTLVLAAGVAKAADTPDAWVTMKAKVALMTTEGISTSDLNVDTVNGVVTLHGKVATEAEKARAGKSHEASMERRTSRTCSRWSRVPSAKSWSVPTMRSRRVSRQRSRQTAVSIQVASRSRQ